MQASRRGAGLPREDSSQGRGHVRYAASSLTLVKNRPFSCFTSSFVFVQPLPIAELDGSVSGDFFTVLCVGQGFTDDQWMNVYSFSMLRHWLLTYHSVPSSGAAADAGTTPLLETTVLSLATLHEQHLLKAPTARL